MSEDSFLIIIDKILVVIAFDLLNFVKEKEELGIFSLKNVIIQKHFCSFLVCFLVRNLKCTRISEFFSTTLAYVFWNCFNTISQFTDFVRSSYHFTSYLSSFILDNNISLDVTLVSEIHYWYTFNFFYCIALYGMEILIDEVWWYVIFVNFFVSENFF